MKIDPKLKKIFYWSLTISFLIAVICDFSRVILNTPIFPDWIKIIISSYGTAGAILFYVYWIITGKIAYPISKINYKKPMK